MFKPSGFYCNPLQSSTAEWLKAPTWLIGLPCAPRANMHTLKQIKPNKPYLSPVSPRRPVKGGHSRPLSGKGLHNQDFAAADEPKEQGLLLS